VGTVVTINGTGFGGASAVFFGSASATPTSVSSTQIIVTAPPHSPGLVNVVVVTPAGSSIANPNARFTFTAETVTYTLNFRWTLLVWAGEDGISVGAALRGMENPDIPVTNDVFSQVTAVFEWIPEQQAWHAYFPGSEGLPGANDLTVLHNGGVYWVAIHVQDPIPWTVVEG
jgi:hypothetical protein